jgi:hypothetical protein
MNLADLEAIAKAAIQNRVASNPITMRAEVALALVAVAKAAEIQLERMRRVRDAEGFSSWPASTQAVQDALVDLGAALKEAR